MHCQHLAPSLLSTCSTSTSSCGHALSSQASVPGYIQQWNSTNLAGTKDPVPMFSYRTSPYKALAQEQHCENSPKRRKHHSKENPASGKGGDDHPYQDHFSPSSWLGADIWSDCSLPTNESISGENTREEPHILMEHHLWKTFILTWLKLKAAQAWTTNNIGTKTCPQHTKRANVHYWTENKHNSTRTLGNTQ